MMYKHFLLYHYHSTSFPKYHRVQQMVKYNDSHIFDLHHLLMLGLMDHKNPNYKHTIANYES